MPKDILSQFLGLSDPVSTSTDSSTEVDAVQLQPTKVKTPSQVTPVDAETRVLANAYRQRIGVQSMAITPEMPAGQNLDIAQDPYKDMKK